jgi:2-oxoglutarate ferredoxin oxidoreductase subunit alpha
MVPQFDGLPKMQITHPKEKNDDHGFMPYKRNENLARPWAIPGTPGLEHRLGGLEKQDITGNVNYEPANHEKMVRLRQAKVNNIKPPGQDILWTGPTSGDLLIVGWGSTYGAIKAATLELRAAGLNLASCHIRYLNPLPAKLGELLRNFKHVMVPEMNLGQLRMLLRSKYLVDAKGLNKIRGQPFTIGEITAGAKALLDGKVPAESQEVEMSAEVDSGLGGGG